MKDLLEWLDAMPPRGDLTHQFQTMAAIRQWCLRQIGFNVGDKVRITDMNIDPTSGWWSYRECLAPGAVGEVRSIGFNRFSFDGKGAWHADVRLDREWSVGEFQGPKRYWHGPVAETPEGYEQPTPYDQEQHPAGRRHTFSIWVERLEQAAPVEAAK